MSEGMLEDPPGTVHEQLLSATALKIRRQPHRADPRVRRGGTAANMTGSTTGLLDELLKRKGSVRNDLQTSRASPVSPVSPVSPTSPVSPPPGGTPPEFRETTSSFGSQRSFLSPGQASSNKPGGFSKNPGLGSEWDESFLRSTVVEDLTLVYTEHTAEVISAIRQGFRDRQELSFDLSTSALRSTDEEKGEDSGGSAAHPSTGSNLRMASYTSAGSMLNQLLADKDTNFTARSTLPPNTTHGKAGDTHTTAASRLYADVVSLGNRIRCPRFQLSFRGPTTTVPITVVAQELVIDRKDHKLHRRNGRLDCKDSATWNFNGTQIYTCDISTPELLEIPHEWIDLGKPGSPSALQACNLKQLATPCTLTFTVISYSHNKRIANFCRPAVIYDGGGREDDLGHSDNVLWDRSIINIDDLQVRVSAGDFEAILDIIKNLIVKDRTGEEDKEHELALQRLQGFISDKDPATEKDRITQQVINLQAAVWKFQVVNNKFERDMLHLSTTEEPPELTEKLNRRKMVLDAVIKRLRDASDEGLEDDEVQELGTMRDLLKSEMQTISTGGGASGGQQAAIELEWARNRKLYRKTRRELRLKVSILRDLLQGPQARAEKQARDWYTWQSQFEGRLGALTAVFVGSDGLPFCRTRINNYEARILSHSLGYNEYVMDCQDVLITDLGAVAGEFNRVASGPIGGASTGAGEKVILGRNLVLADKHALDTTESTLRMHSNGSMPVGGIPVTDHFEVKIVPLTVNINEAIIEKFTKFLGIGDSNADSAILTPPDSAAAAFSGDAAGAGASNGVTRNLVRRSSFSGRLSKRSSTMADPPPSDKPLTKEGGGKRGEELDVCLTGAGFFA